MVSNRITIRVPKELEALLRHRSRSRGQTPSDIVRDALETYLGRGGGSLSAYELARGAGIIACATGAPKDLSSNRRHFDGFGKKE